MKTITLNKKARVEAPKNSEGVVAFQLIEFVINFFGNEIKTVHDTKIMANGDQFVIGGCGYIEDGFKVN